MLRKKEGEYLSSSGVDTIKYSVWSGEGRRGIVHLLHGMAEYIDRYDDTAEFFVSQGYVVCGQDHIGHGRSAAEGGLGYFAKKDGYKYLVEDSKLMGDIIRAEYPGLPYIVYGHSMGSFIARLYFEKYGSDFAAAVFTGTSGKNPAAGVVKAIGSLTKLFHGEKAEGRMIAGLMNKIYLSKIPNARTVFDWISTDETVVDKYAADKWCGYTFTASGYQDLMNLLQRCNSKKWYDGIPKDVPVLLLSGCDDPVGGYGEGVREVLSGMIEHEAFRTEIKLFDGMRHEPHNEKERLQALTFIAEWLDTEVK